MPKYIVPFQNSTKWEKNSKCRLCGTIDYLYNDAITTLDQNLKQQKLDDLDIPYFLTNGYDLVRTFEKNGAAIYDRNKLDQLKQLKTTSDLFMKRVNKVLEPSVLMLPRDPKIDDPVLLHSRWCHACGARKPDIYDPSNEDIIYLANIDNFVLKQSSRTVYMTWTDIDANSLYYVKVIRTEKEKPNPDVDNTTGHVLIKYTCDAKNKFQVNPFIDYLPKVGIAYYYQVIAYDRMGKFIKSSKVLDAYVKSTDFTAPSKITDLTVEQVREVELGQDGLYHTNDYIVSTWTNPTSADWDGTLLRAGENFVPNDEQDGILVTNKQLIDGVKIKYNTLYYLKPFPYDRVKQMPIDNNHGYYDYRNYKCDSGFAYLTTIAIDNIVRNIWSKAEDGYVELRWEEIEGGNHNWAKTRIVIKENEYILNDNDGIIIEEIEQRNNYINDIYKIVNLNNETKYYIGIFPVDTNGICSVSTDNQICITPGYYVEDIVLDFSDTNAITKFDYVKRWHIDYDKDLKKNVLTTSMLDPEDYNYCFFNVFGLKYGGKLQFKYKAATIRGFDFFIFYIDGVEVFRDTGGTGWKTYTLDLEPCDYINLRFEYFKHYTHDTTGDVSIADIVLKYNTGQESS